MHLQEAFKSAMGKAVHWNGWRPDPKALTDKPVTYTASG